ncbi:protein YgfX [Duganella sp. BuS-21]|uniref:protein YgfX n=1 Tax=Duganella sp. BuS-21 TaxID=2943848 RepID=UPI0035A6115F
MSVIVRPSCGLRIAHAGLCCCVLASAAACPGVAAPCLCLLMGVLGWLFGRPSAIARQLDISGVGRVRLAVYQHNDSALCRLDGATLWPRLLLLRLRDASGGVRTLAVLPDSVRRHEWRALALACRAATRAQINTPAA